MRQALRAPAFQIATNAQVDAAVIVDKIANESGNVGYDAYNVSTCKIPACRVLN